MRMSRSIDVATIATAKRRGRPIGLKNKPQPLPDLPPLTPTPVAMRIPDAANYIGVSPGYMKQLVAKSKVRSTAIGRTRLVLVASLHELLRDGL